MKTANAISLLLLLGSIPARPAPAENWPQFRGPGGAGVSSDDKIPTTWSDTQNLKWKLEMPGPGSSSPIVWGDLVLLTSYSGYGLDRDNVGDIENLKRHLTCVDRKLGKVVWSRTVDAVMPEDPYSGVGIPEHGYASNTPVTDGQRVYAFFGKSGVMAFDMNGQELWRVDVGHESSDRRWGSAASLILHKDLVIVNASEESQSIRALDRATGKEAWKAEASSLTLAYSTPVVVATANGRNELVLGVPDEVWGLDADTGKLLWHADSPLQGNICPLPVVDQGVAYIFGGYRGTGALAVRTGGSGDVTSSHVVWTSRETSYVPSPVFYDGKLYWVDDMGIAYCMEANSGDVEYRERLPRPEGGARGKPFYASMVLAGGRLFAVSRTGGVYVLAAKPEYELLAQNRFTGDTSDFNGTPAVSDGQLLLRSNRFLYCVEAQ